MIYLKYLKLHIKTDLQYKKSLILNLISNAFVFFTYYFTILALFNKFNYLKGYTLYEVLLTFSIIQIGFSFNEVFFRGLDRFDDLIITGDFDKMLTKPLPIITQILCYKVELVKVSKLLQGIIILVISLMKVDITWNIMKVLVLIFMIVSAALIFFGIFLLAAAYCFYTVQGLEVRNLFTDGGKHMAQYPIGIFKKGFMFIFTFIIPYGIVNYYPLLYFVDKSDNILLGLSPLLIVLFLIPCFLIFKKGMKRYTSCG